MANELESKIVDTGKVTSTLDELMKDTTDEEVIDLDDDKEKVEKKEEKESEKKEDFDTDSEDDEIDEKKELDDDTDEIIAPPNRKAILAKFPELFKEFPFLEKMMYRDRDLVEIGITSPDKARELVERNQDFEKFESDLFKGDSTSILKALKQNDPEAFAKLVDNYIPVLYKTDPVACAHIVNNFHRNTIKEMVTEAAKTSNDDLKQAAAILHQWVFGKSDWEEPKGFAKPSAKVSDDVNEERASFERERFESAREDVLSKFNNALESTISQHIDPRGSMSAYVKKNAIKDALNNISDLITSDKRFKAILDKRWEEAKTAKYSREAINKIKSTLLSRAKADLRDVIRKARTEALQGVGTRKVKDDENDETTRKQLPVGNTASRNGGNKKNEIPKGMSTKDFFMQD